MNDPPESDPQTVDTDEDVPVDITHVGRDKDLVNIFTRNIFKTKKQKKHLHNIIIGLHVCLHSNGLIF